jgi:hypothetical protein
MNNAVSWGSCKLKSIVKNKTRCNRNIYKIMRNIILKLMNCKLGVSFESIMIVWKFVTEMN